MTRAPFVLVPVLVLCSCTTPVAEPTPDPLVTQQTRLGGAQAFDATGKPYAFVIPLPDAGTAEVAVDRVQQMLDTVTLYSSLAPGVSARLRVTAEPGFTRFTVVSHAGALRGVSALFEVPRDYDCHVGFADWAYEQHSCGGPKGTVASFCATAACDNALVQPGDPTVGLPRLGARLASTPARELDGAGFLLYEDPAPFGTPASARALHDFFSRVRPARGVSSSWLISSPPVTPGGGKGERWWEESAVLAAARAKDLHFKEALLLDRQWAKSMGAWDSRVPFAKLSQPFTEAGVCPIAHTLVSLLDHDNPLCAPGAPPSPAACPSDAWLRDAQGNPVLAPGGGPGNFMWNSASRKLVDAVAGSYAQGITAGNACGVYADAADWFMTDGAGLDWAATLREKVPAARLRMSVANSSLALFTDETDITDQWQVLWSNTPADWAFNWGYHLQRGEWQHLGIAPRLGWVPPPEKPSAPASYVPMLRSAVATGAFITLQMEGDHPAISDARYAWFRDALRESNDAIEEIRAGEAVAVPGESDARHDVLHFSNGVSTIALFDQILPSSVAGTLEARSHGAPIDTGAACGPFAACFRFNGSLRYPPTWQGPHLTDPGSYLMLPAHPATRTSSVSMSVWFRAEGSNGLLIAKGPLGYGVYTYTDAATGALRVGGHLSGAQPGWFMLGDYATVTPNAWHHFAYAYDDATKRVTSFVDGQKFLDVTVTGRGDAVTSALTPTWVGSAPGAGPFQGWLNDVRVYNRALSDAEVASLGSQGKPLPSLSSGVISALEASTPASAPAVVDVALGEQRTAWLVPMVHGAGALPAEKVRLSFDGPFRRLPRVQACAAAGAPRLTRSGTLVIDVDAAAMGGALCRVHVD